MKNSLTRIFLLSLLALCLLLGWAIWKPLGKYIRGEDIR